MPNSKTTEVTFVLRLTKKENERLERISKNRFRSKNSQIKFWIKENPENA